MNGICVFKLQKRSPTLQQRTRLPLQEMQEMWVRSLGHFPWRRKWQPSPVFFPGKFHGQRGLVGSSPWGHRESDVTERVSTHTHAHNSVAKWVVQTPECSGCLDNSSELCLLMGGFQCSLAGKESTCNAETWVRFLGWEDPLEKGKAPHSVFWPGEFHGLYSLWGLTQSNK